MLFPFDHYTLVGQLREQPRKVCYANQLIVVIIFASNTLRLNNKGLLLELWPLIGIGR